MFLLNDKGDNALFHALKAKVYDFDGQSFGDWISHAEARVMVGEWTIELLAHETISGKPEVIAMPKAWFFKRP